jgi:hypothetical protein
MKKLHEFFSKNQNRSKSQKNVFAGKGGHIPLFPDPIPPLPNLLLDRGVKAYFSSVTGKKKFCVLSRQDTKTKDKKIK